MPIDPVQRVANWDEKYNIERITAMLTEKRPVMLQHVTAVTSQITAMELQVKQVCDGAGVSTIQLPYYLCFGREMWSLIRRDVSGETLAKAAKVLIDKWKARGLTEAVLQGIRTDVFNVAAPIGP